MNTLNGNACQAKTIRLRTPTLARIDELKHKGQSYDGVITELLDYHDNCSPESKQNQTSGKRRKRATGDI